MGWHLDGRVAAVFGTHTHVPTADGRVLPQRHRLHLRRRHDRLAAPASSGSSPSRRWRSLITQMPTRFETAEEDVWVMGAVVEVNERGLADSIEQVMVPAPTSCSSGASSVPAARHASATSSSG